MKRWKFPLPLEERSVIVALGRRLLGEADLIEKKQDRILFYFDALEELIGDLEAPARRRR